MKNWETHRQRKARQQENRRMILAAFILIAIALAYSAAFKPLPGNLEASATSNSAVYRLKK